MLNSYPCYLAVYAWPATLPRQTQDSLQMLWLAAYLMGLPPTGLYTLSWTHGLTPMLFFTLQFFMGSDPESGQASAIVYTMVEMAKANGVNVYHYLTYLLEKQPNDSMSDEELDQLAPWNEDVKAELRRRAESSDE